MYLALPRFFSVSLWKDQFNIIRNFSSRTKLLLLLLAGVSLGILATGVVLRQRRRRYQPKSPIHVGGVVRRQSTFTSSSSRSSHRRIDSFPSINIIDEDEDDNRRGGVESGGRSSVDISMFGDENQNPRNDSEMFLSLSQNLSAGPLSDEYYDVLPELENLIPVYPSMTEPVVGLREEDYLSDSDDSFASASETLNFRSERDQLYQSALVLAGDGSVKCRRMRTTVLGCSSDIDFLAKLHCVRQALDRLMLSEDNRQYTINAGRDMIVSLLNTSNMDPQPFISRYDDILEFIQNPENLATAEQELKSRGVTNLNIYDVALDFMLMDAFDDLASPPSALLSVIRNGWISDGIKQSMLNTAVWSILKAKKSVLKNKDGFMSRFYLLSETMSPVFAWGFMGTNEELKDHCLRFKNGMMSYLQSIFSLEAVRYSTTQTLADDIMRLTRQTANSLSVGV